MSGSLLSQWFKHNHYVLLWPSNTIIKNEILVKICFSIFHCCILIFCLCSRNRHFIFISGISCWCSSKLWSLSLLISLSLHHFCGDKEWHARINVQETVETGAFSSQKHIRISTKYAQVLVNLKEWLINPLLTIHTLKV